MPPPGPAGRLTPSEAATSHYLLGPPGYHECDLRRPLTAHPCGPRLAFFWAPPQGATAQGCLGPWVLLRVVSCFSQHHFPEEEAVYFPPSPPSHPQTQAPGTNNPLGGIYCRFPGLSQHEYFTLLQGTRSLQQGRSICATQLRAGKELGYGGGGRGWGISSLPVQCRNEIPHWSTQPSPAT